MIRILESGVAGFPDKTAQSTRLLPGLLNRKLEEVGGMLIIRHATCMH